MNTAVILQILAGLAGIVSLWLKEYYSEENKVARKERRNDEELQQGRRDIESGNIDAVTARIDRLLSKENDRNARIKNDEVKAGRGSSV